MLPKGFPGIGIGPRGVGTGQGGSGQFFMGNTGTGVVGGNVGNLTKNMSRSPEDSLYTLAASSFSSDFSGSGSGSGFTDSTSGAFSSGIGQEGTAETF